MKCQSLSGVNELISWKVAGERKFLWNLLPNAASVECVFKLMKSRIESCDRRVNIYEILVRIRKLNNWLLWEKVKLLCCCWIKLANLVNSWKLRKKTLTPTCILKEGESLMSGLVWSCRKLATLLTWYVYYSLCLSLQQVLILLLCIATHDVYCSLFTNWTEKPYLFYVCVLIVSCGYLVLFICIIHPDDEFSTLSVTIWRIRRSSVMMLLS